MGQSVRTFKLRPVAQSSPRSRINQSTWLDLLSIVAASRHKLARIFLLSAGVVTSKAAWPSLGSAPQTNREATRMQMIDMSTVHFYSNRSYRRVRCEHVLHRGAEVRQVLRRQVERRLCLVHM